MPNRYQFLQGKHVVNRLLDTFQKLPDLMTEYSLSSINRPRETKASFINLTEFEPSIIVVAAINDWSYQMFLIHTLYWLQYSSLQCSFILKKFDVTGGWWTTDRLAGWQTNAVADRLTNSF